MAFSFVNLRPQEKKSGSGIFDALGDLAQKKAHKYQNQKLYEEVLGLPPEVAKQFANYELKDVMGLLEAVGKKSGGMDALYGMQGQSGMANQGQQNMMPQRQQQQQRQPQQPQLERVPTEQSMQAMQDFSQSLRLPTGMRNEQAKNFQPQFEQRMVEPQKQQFAQQQMQPQGAQQQMQQQQMQPQGYQQQIPRTVGQALMGQTKADVREERKLQLKEREVFGKEEADKRKDSRDAFKAHLPFINDVYDTAKQSANKLQLTERMKELESEGVESQAWNELLKSSGIDSAALRNGSAQEFIKIRQAFIPGVGKIFGGKVSNFELEQWMKSIPDLANTPDGRKRIIAGMDRVNRANEREAEVLGEIIEEYDEKNKPLPNHLRGIINKRMQKENEEFTRMFKEDLKRPVPAASNRAVTAGAGLLGSALNYGGKIAVPAAIGAGIGTLGGPLGGLGGAALGGLGGLGSILYGLSSGGSAGGSTPPGI